MGQPQIDGCVQFYIAVPPQQMKHWPAEAIKQFFNGIAMIVYAAGKNAHVEMVHAEERPTDDQSQH